jgi:hypothetical protein
MGMTRELQELTPQILDQLVAAEGGCCVSILLETAAAGPDTKQGALQLKNQLKKVEEILQARELEGPDLSELRQLVEETEFWQHQASGLAIFLSREQCQLIRLHKPVTNQVVVGTSFFVKPLFAQQTGGYPYWVVAISWDQVALHRGTQTSLEMVRTSGLPAKFHDLVLPRDPEEQLQYASHRPRGMPGAGGGSVMYHGHGEGEEKIEADRRSYLMRAAKRLADAIQPGDQPIFLVATDEVAGHFRSASDLEVAEHVSGSPEELSESEILSRCNEIVEKLGEAAVRDFHEELGTEMARDRGSTELSQIVPAAYHKKISRLMVANDRECWVDPATHQPDSPAAGGDELTNRALLETVRGGGEVLVCNASGMPQEGSLAAAIFRY